MTKTPNIQYIAAKALIKNSSRQVLVLKQSDPTITGHNMYHPPGGILEPGESLKECVEREVKEELGVDCTAVTLFDVGEWQAERGDDVMQFVGLYYVCTITDEDFTIQTSEASEARWVGLQDLDKIDVMEPSRSIITAFILTE